MLAMADVCADYPKSAGNDFTCGALSGRSDTREVLYFCPVWCCPGSLWNLLVYLPVVLSVFDQFPERRFGQHHSSESHLLMIIQFII